MPQATRVTKNTCGSVVHPNRKKYKKILMRYPRIFEIGAMNVAFRFLSNLPPAWKSQTIFMMSFFKSTQQVWNNAIEKPSRPSNLLPFIAFTTSNTSPSSKSL
jgi:hypothetical protein